MWTAEEGDKGKKRNAVNLQQFYANQTWVES